MKYTQGYSGRKSRFGTGFYVIIAVCLLIVGGASWFALSNYNNEDGSTAPEIESSSEYQDNVSSYIESESQMIESGLNDATESVESFVSEQTGEQVSDEPYSSEEPVTKTEENIKSFTMPVEGEIIKSYSDSQLQYSATYGDMRLHSGVDIACKKGTAVSACSDGTVVSVDLNTSFGNTVSIDHGDGITVKYASLDDIKVKQGAKVNVGDIIGTVTTVPAECSDKDHLHLEVSKDGEILSPLEALNLN